MSLQVTALLNIQDGKKEQFQEVANKCRTLVAENEQNTNLLYDWFIREMQCEVRETYVDSEAFLKHLENVGEPLGRLLQIADLVVIRIYGEPSAEVMTALTGLPVEVYAPLSE
jgi:hypothetical protein